MGKIVLFIMGALLGLGTGLARIQMGNSALVGGAILLIVLCLLMTLACWMGRQSMYELLAGNFSGTPHVPSDHARETAVDLICINVLMPIGSVLAIAPFIIFG